MKLKNKKDLLEVVKNINLRQNDLRDFFDTDFMSDEISDLLDFTLEYYNIEKENNEEFEHLMSYCDGEITKEKLLKRWK